MACYGFADIAIAIDDSSSTRRQPGNVVSPGQLELARYFVENSALDADNINLAFVAHSNTARVVASFTADTAVLENALNTFAPEFSGDNVGSGLDTSISLLLNSGRQGARKFIVFMVDARPDDGINAVLQAVRARLASITVVPVAFASGFFISDLELSLLAADAGSWRRTSSDATLITLADDITALVCPGGASTASTVGANRETSAVSSSMSSTTADMSTITSEMTTTSMGMYTIMAEMSTPSYTNITIGHTEETFMPCSNVGLANSVVYVSDPNDESKFIQCFQNTSGVSYTSEFCRFGTVWNDALGTCTDPLTAPNDPCSSMLTGDVRQYDISCNAYWECIGFFPHSNATCCPPGQAFDGSSCVADITCTQDCPPPAEFEFPVFCPYVPSPAGAEYYRVVTNDFFIDKACPSGLSFDFNLCYCNGTSTDFCNEDLRLTFENQSLVDSSKNQQRLTLYPGKRLFVFRSDTSVNFWGPNYIIVPGFANKEFRRLSAVVVFEPTGATDHQVLLHNGPLGDPLGPSVKISISDNSTFGLLDVMFTVVMALDTTAEAVPLVLSVERGGPIEAQLMYDGTQVTAKLLKNGVLVASTTRHPAFIDDSISLRKGAFNIGGGGCIECNNFVGSMDYIKVFDCVADQADLGEAPAAGLQDIITARDTNIRFPTRPPRFLPAATTPSHSDNIAQCTFADYFNGIAHTTYSGDCGKFLQCQVDTSFQFNATLKDCPFGTMWSSGQGACSRPFQAECDPCRGAVDNSRFPYPNYCQAFLQCSGGISQIKCCADNQLYDEGLGCIEDTLNSCNNTCLIEPDPEYFCFLTESSQGLGFYLDQIIQLDLPCPPGLGFNSSQCACSDVIGDTSRACEPYLDIGFESSEIKDFSSNKFVLDYNFVSISGGLGDFSNSRAYVSVPGTANVEYFGAKFGLGVNFTAPSTLIGNQTIVFNGAIGSEAPSIKLSISGSTTSIIIVSFLVVTEDDTRETTLEVSASSSGPIQATVVYDGLKVTARTVSSLGTQTSVRATQGNVLRRQGAMNIGSGLCFGLQCEPFSGLLSSVKLYLCAPRL